MRALVVDDEPGIRELVRVALEAEGFAVDEARSGLDALERVTVEPRPDVVVLDVMMPELDGWEVLRQMKANADSAVVSTPVVMLTARSGEFDRVQAGIEGAVRYVTKPFKVVHLVDVVREVLDSDEADERRRAQTQALTDLARIEKREAGRQDTEPPLSTRQREIVMAVVRHGKVPAAAAELGVSRNSIYVGLRRAAWRLGLSDIDEVLAMARDRVWPFNEEDERVR